MTTLMSNEVSDELCVCIEPGCCHLHLYRYAEDSGTEYWWAISSCHGMGFWNRVKLAWQVLRGHDIDANGMMFNGKAARSVRDWLTKQIEQGLKQ